MNRELDAALSALVVQMHMLDIIEKGEIVPADEYEHELPWQREEYKRLLCLVATLTNREIDRMYDLVPLTYASHEPDDPQEVC